MGKRTKILQIGMSWSIGGTETYLMQQYRNINKNILHYDFVNINCHHKMAFNDELLHEGSKIYKICSRHKNPVMHYWQWYKLLKRVSKEYKAIVLNSNSLEYVFPLFLAKFFDVPMRIIHSHNAGFQNKIGVLRKVLIAFNKILLKWSATNYFACSRTAGKWMFGNTEFQIIHNAIVVENFVFNENKRKLVRKNLGLEGQFVVGHIGRFDYQKNHEFLIKVFNEIQKVKGNSILLLIGNGVNESKIVELVDNLRLSNKVRFLGVRNDVIDLLQSMDCFVLPSRFGGLPLVGIEAQAAGLPCFFADTITDELAITNLAHYISLDDSTEKWAEQVCKLGDVERVDMGEKIKDAGYDIKTEIKNLEMIYLEGC